MYFSHQMGSVVSHLRELRRKGARISDMLDYLGHVVPNDYTGAIKYLNLAFCQGSRLTNLLFSFDGKPDPDLALAAESWIDERRDQWEQQPFPELHSTRDYFAFSSVAFDEKLTIFVCGARQGEIGYRLHGVYTDRGEPAWTARRGEHLRGTLNRRLGGEIIRTGPQDDWEYRNTPDRAGPLYGPQLPVIEFSHEYTIRAYPTANSLVHNFIYRRRWAQLYPHHPIKP